MKKYVKWLFIIGIAWCLLLEISVHFIQINSSEAAFLLLTMMFPVIVWYVFGDIITKALEYIEDLIRNIKNLN